MTKSTCSTNISKPQYSIFNKNGEIIRTYQSSSQTTFLGFRDELCTLCAAASGRNKDVPNDANSPLERASTLDEQRLVESMPASLGFSAVKATAVCVGKEMGRLSNTLVILLVEGGFTKVLLYAIEWRSCCDDASALKEGVMGRGD